MADHVRQVFFTGLIPTRSRLRQNDSLWSHCHQYIESDVEKFRVFDLQELRVELFAISYNLSFHAFRFLDNGAVSTCACVYGMEFELLAGSST